MCEQPLVWLLPPGRLGSMPGSVSLRVQPASDTPESDVHHLGPLPQPWHGQVRPFVPGRVVA